MPPHLPDAGDLRSKGFTLKGALAFVESRWGEQGRQRLLDASSAEDQAVLRGRILPSTWYPFRIQVGLYETIDRLFGRGDLELCWEVGKFTSENELKTIHKAFLRVAGLDLWVRTAGLMWGRYYSAGHLRVEEIGRRSGSVLVTDFNPISKAFCFDFGGWLHRTVELANYNQVRIEHDACLLDGADACRFSGRWA